MPVAKTLNRYKLIGGPHVAEDVTAEPLKNEDGTPKLKKDGSPCYPVVKFDASRNNIVVSADDLTKKYVNKFVFAGPYAGRSAFTTPVDPVPSSVDGSSPSKFVRADLEAMSVADLKALAAEEEIDLGGAHLKAQIVDAILAAK